MNTVPVARLILQNLKKNLLDAASTGIVNLVLWVTQQALRLNKSMSTWQVKEVLKSAKYTWRRVRKSMKKQRDECLFEFFKQEIVELCVLDKKKLIRLWFYGESGFNLNPNALYAWLPPHKEAKNISLPAKRGNVLTVAGFPQHDNTLEAYSHKEAMNAHSFIAFTEDFIRNQVLGSNIQNIVIIY